MKIEHSISGNPQDLSFKNLPTRQEVYKCYLWLKNEEPNATKIKIIDLLAEKLTSIWQKASIITISSKTIIGNLKDLISELQALSKYDNKRRKNPNFIDKLTKFNLLFNIRSCKCIKKSNELNNCKCAVKIPAKEWNFWLDQNSERCLTIGGVDVKDTAKLRRTITNN